jgi:hypothetical protein
MYKYLVAFLLLAPLLGVWMVEGGEYAGSIGVTGYANGATFAFALYAVGVAVIATLCATDTRAPAEVFVPSRVADARFRTFSNKLLFVEVAYLLIFLFGFGAVGTWFGDVGKGEFRVGLGEFGAFPNSMSKFIEPALVTYAALLYRRSSRTAGIKLRLGVILLLVFVTGASRGFKATAIAGVTPALLVLYWRVRPIQLIMLAVLFFGSLTLFFFYFDADIAAVTDVQTALVRRITVLQGDVPWYIWGLHSSGVDFPSYWPTLLAALGDKVLGAVGIMHSDYYQWMLYHYDWMITYLSDVPVEQIAEGGHTIVGTPFSEGLVAGGVPGLVLFTVIAGVLTGRMYAYIARALRTGRDVPAALGATYFCYFLVPWLNAGAIVQLFHISLIVNIGGTLLALAVMRRRWTLGPPAYIRVAEEPTGSA